MIVIMLMLTWKCTKAIVCNSKMFVPPTHHVKIYLGDRFFIRLHLSVVCAGHNLFWSAEKELINLLTVFCSFSTQILIYTYWCWVNIVRVTRIIAAHIRHHTEKDYRKKFQKWKKCNNFHTLWSALNMMFMRRSYLGRLSRALVTDGEGNDVFVEGICEIFIGATWIRVFEEQLKIYLGVKYIFSLCWSSRRQYRR